MEIKRKFLIWENGGEFANPSFYNKFGNLSLFAQRIRREGNTINQGYLEPTSLEGELLDIRNSIGFEPSEARLRSEVIRLDGKTEYTFTLKGSGDLSRKKHEENIIQEVFQRYWSKTLRKRISKNRLKLPFQAQNIEFDSYLDRNLLTTEVEFDSVEIADSFPEIGLDITNDSRYKNKNLAQ
jgi:CYTH domain-containing protein